MKNIILLVVLAVCSIKSSAQTTITIMDSVIFIDGYAAYSSTPTPPPGVIKLRNDLFTRKLTTVELQSIGTSLQMNVVINALCDNYDRIGNVNMALVPTGSTTYNPDSVQHIELGRFITPFFNKNIQPDSVPYTFNIDNVAMLLKDTTITNLYDIWLELAVFGVPYAANTQVAGCSGRNDVFLGKLQFITNTAAPSQNSNILLPLFFNNNFNNYQTGATDTIGLTTKTITFTVPNNLTDAALFLITSNHGSNSGGEEYNRRFHYAYFDGQLKLTYKPGRLTCEPFRQYNTQSNGIYGPSPRTPAQWQSFSNWCPGDVIDIRRINLGPLTAGSHTFLIRVPTAIFTGGQGNFPLSLYLQGRTSGIVASVSDYVEEENFCSIYPNPFTSETNIAFTSPQKNTLVRITDMLGREAKSINFTGKTLVIERGDMHAGVYFVNITSENNTILSKKIIVQ